MSEPEPEYVWVFPPDRRRTVGRIWLIVGLSIAAALIAGAAFWFFVRPGLAEPSATPTPSASASVTPSPSASASATPTPSASPTPGSSSPPSATDAPVPPVPPVPSDPSLSTFRDAVEPVLDSASTGLRYAREDGGMSAMNDIMLLQDDASRLSEKLPPSSIAARWSPALETYTRSLEPLRAAYERGEDANAEESAASAALNDLNAVLGR